MSSYNETFKTTEYLFETQNYGKQITVKSNVNFCVTLLRKKKADYFNNLDLILVRDKKMFWKTISSYFVNNPEKRPKITSFDEKDNTLSADEQFAETFNEYFWELKKT